jgi:hypothetical protein
MGRRLLILGGCALLVAGCGGSKKQEVGNLYKLGGASACLREHGFRVSTKEKDVGFVAYTATGGGLRAWEKRTNGRVSLILAFGQSGDDAKQTLVAVKRFARRPPIFRWRARRANAVILFAYRPSLKNQRLVVNCLEKSARASS